MINTKNKYLFQSKANVKLLVKTTLFLTFILTTCTKSQDFTQGKFEPWLSADLLFRQDSLWRGGDAAYSVDLGKGRILWLFGDSFVGGGPNRTRSNRRMVRNTIGIQNGYTPAKATMKFYYGKILPIRSKPGFRFHLLHKSPRFLEIDK